MLFVFATLFLNSLHVATSQRYLVYHREGAYKVPVVVEFDPTNQLARISAQSREERLQTLYDFRTRTIVYRDVEGRLCFLEPMSNENFSREQRILQAIQESVLPSSPESLSVYSRTIPGADFTAHWGSSITYFCNSMKYFMVHKAENGNNHQSDSHNIGRLKRNTDRVSRQLAARKHYDPAGKQGAYGKNWYKAGQKTSFGQHSTPVTDHGSQQMGPFSKQKSLTGQMWPYEQPSQRQMGPYGQFLPSQGQQGPVGQHFPLPLADQDGSSFGQQPLLSGQSGPQFGQQMPLLGQGGSQFGQQAPLPGQYGPPFGQQAPPLPGQYWPPFGQQGPLPGQGGPTSGQVPAPQPGEQGATGGQQGPVGEQALAAGIPPDGGSSSSSRVRYGQDKATAVAAAHGAFRGGQAQTNVQGGSSRDGSFQAHAQSEFDFGQVDSQVRGFEGQATSLAASKVTGVANTRTHTRLDYGGTGEAHARGTSPQGLTVAQTEGLGRRGQASSRARGIGMTSSQAEVGAAENATGTTTTNAVGDVQEVSASSQGGFFQGNSQSHVRGRGHTNAASARSAFGQDAERDFADEDRNGADSPPSATVLPDGSISQTVPQPGTDSATPPDGTSTVYQLGPSYFTLVDPRTGAVDPRNGAFSPVDPRTGLPPVDRAPEASVSVDPRTGLAPEIDPRTGLPTPVDPRTGLPTPVDPRTGLPTPVDPRMGFPLAWSQPGLPVPGQDPHQVQQVPFTGYSPTSFKAKPKLPHVGQHSVPIAQYPPISPHQEQQFPQAPVSQIPETKQKTIFQPHHGETQPPFWQHGQIKPKDPYLYGGQGQPMHKSSGMDYIQKLKAGLGKSITQQQHYLQAQQPFVGQPLASDQCIYETGKRCSQGYKMTNTVRLCVPLCAV